MRKLSSTQAGSPPPTDGDCGIIWFRNDLRVEDNPAWDDAVRSHRRVVAVHVLDPGIDKLTGPFRRRRHHLEIHALDETLRAHGGRLHILRGSPIELIPRLVEVLGATKIHVNAAPSPLSQDRDAAVAGLLPESARMSSHWGNLIQPPGSLVTKDGNVPRVFTAFWKRWRNAAPPKWADHATEPASTSTEVLDLTRGCLSPFLDSDFSAHHPSGEDLDDLDPELQDIERQVGTDGAHALLAAFVDNQLADYAERRDTMSMDATSDLSVALHFGTIAPVRVLAVAASSGEESDPFIRQLAWRDWYAHLLWEKPALPNSSIRPEFDSIRWRNDPDEIDAWKQGLTGYPIVDAGMRQLARTGRMHNRVRMMVASFLVKDLLVDWRIGERYFRRMLLDGDVAQNAGNWQWVAGTGPDAAPYFRIFNPVRQGETHDPDGVYVKRWLPELSGLPTRHVHAPWQAPEEVLARAGVSIGRDYPGPIVAHSEARNRTLAAYKNALNR